MNSLLLVRRCGIVLGLVMACLFAGHALAQADEMDTDTAPLRFGVLPLGGALESRRDWKPLLDEMAREIGRPVMALSMTSYESLQDAIQEQRVDMAFLSGKLAVDAVAQYGMVVLNQVIRPDGLPGYRSVLIARKEGPVDSLEDVLNQPGRWSLGRGQMQSMSGYVIPLLQLFGPHDIAIERYFRSELVGGHQNLALAVSNGQVDVATNNTADLEHFKARFPLEAKRLKILWESDLIPHGVMVMRETFPAELRLQVQQFLQHYAQGDDDQAAAQRTVLLRLHGLAGFPLADARALLPLSQLDYQLEKLQVLSGRWVSEEARQAKLARIEAKFEEERRRLTPVMSAKAPPAKGHIP